MKSLKQLLLLAAILCGGLFARANDGETKEKKSIDGRLHGYVMDAVTRKPVKDVTVSVSSNKVQNSREIQSDAAGYFHFSKLPPGELTLMFEKKGYKVYRRDLLPVKEGAVTKIAVDFQPVDQDGGNEMWHPLLKMLH